MQMYPSLSASLVLLAMAAVPIAADFKTGPRQLQIGVTPAASFIASYANLDLVCLCV